MLNEIKKHPNLPDKPGTYGWVVSDWGYCKLGYMQVLKDSEKHLQYLRDSIKKGENDWQFYIYQNSADETLTVYWGAKDNLPDKTVNGEPCIDDYFEFDLLACRASYRK